MRDRSLIVLVLSVSSALTLGGIELAVRGLAADERWYDVEMWRYAAEVKVPDADPRRVFAHRPDVRTSLYRVPFRTNHRGFRQDEEVADQPTPGVPRVLVLGDSMTMAWGVPVEDGYVARLPALLGAPVELLNTGVGAYNAVQEAATLQALGPALDPDVVLVAWSINDPEPLPGLHSDRPWQRSRALLLLWGRLDRLGRDLDTGETWEPWYRRLYRDENPGWGAALAAVDEMGAWCRARGVPCVAALLPEFHHVGADFPFTAEYRRVMERYRAAGFVAVASMAERFPTGPGGGWWVSAEDAHPNADAHAILAEGVAELLRVGLGAGQPP